MADKTFPVRAVLTEEEIRALEMPFPGEVSYSDIWRDYDAGRDARARGRLVLRRAIDDRTRYERPEDLRADEGESLIRVLLLSLEAEALLMEFPRDHDPVEYWADFHSRRTDRNVGRATLGRALEDHRRAAS